MTHGGEIPPSAALDWADSRLADNEIMAMISWSLGSKATFDAIEKLPVSQRATIASRTSHLYMLANQLPLLALADADLTIQALSFESVRSNPMAAPANDSLASFIGARQFAPKALHGTRALLTIVAFSDPNDLLSYPIPTTFKPLECGDPRRLDCNDPAAPGVRTTKDIDVIIKIASTSKYYELGDRLRALGFAEDQSEGAPICRWKLGEDLVLDVMPTRAEIVGFSNRWYPGAVITASVMHLEDDLPIRVVTAPYYSATKLEAFHDRGKNDVLVSHDLEDLIAVVDGRPELSEEVRRADDEVRRFLAAEADALLANDQFLEALPGFVPSDEGRGAIILNRLGAIANIR